MVFARSRDELKVCTRDGCLEPGRQLLSRITFFTMLIAECTAKARVMIGPMRAFVGEHCMIRIDADKGLKRY